MPHTTSDFTILVVDDEPSLRAVTTRILQAQGYKVWEASDSPEALVQLARLDYRVDLLLTDLHLGETLGTDLAEWARGLCPEIRVLFMTGDTGRSPKSDAERAMIAGRCLDKPFTMLELGAAVRTALESAED